MGFWNKFGKIGLTVAPYVAAPFTGGASLAFAPAANRAVSAWNQRDAAKNAAKGLAPSKTDQYIGLGGEIGGMAGGLGAFGKGGELTGWQKQVGNVGNIVGGGQQGGGGGGWGQMVGQVLDRIPRGGQPSQGQAVPREGQAQDPGRRRAIGGSRALPNMDIRTPNLAHPLLQGINQARAGRQMPPVDPRDYMSYNW